MTPSEFDAVWRRCAPFLSEALARDPSHSLEDVRALVEAPGAMVCLWPGERSAAVTELITHPRLRELHVWLAGGDLEELRRGLPSIEAFAAALGCQRVSLFGRPGWTRALDGYAPQFVAMAKMLAPCRTGLETKREQL
ncbi:MAG TPA: hypothetical protein VG939_19755 [Caulobacteraceae bacterium]|nr:hypothetical protein [Caulobacteraceae bacterium]